MRSALWAEWTIALFSDRNRAAAIVGDLLETTTQRGSFWFWLSVAGIVLSLIWRSAIAILAALWIGRVWQIFATRTFYYAGHLGLRLHPFDPREPLFSVVWFGAALSTAASYAAIRYGLRDKFVQLALGLWGLITIVVLCWRMPVVAVACTVLALAILVASIRSAQWSRALAALTPALVFGFGGGLLVFALRVLYFSLVGYDRNVGMVNGFTSFLTAGITMLACARMHNRVLRRDQRAAEIQSPN